MAANALFLLIVKFFLASFCGEGRGKLQEVREMTDPIERDSETELMLKGYGLTTAEMYYRMPDYTNVLNSFVWQDFDLAPDYPRLFKFIEFWQEEIDGPLHSVRFTHRKRIGPSKWRNVVGELRYQ